MNQIIAYIKRIRKYLNCNLIIQVFFTGFIGVLILCVAMAQIARVIPFYYEPQVDLIVCFAGVCYVVLVVRHRWISMQQAAKYGDSFGLKERLVTLLSMEKESDSIFYEELIGDTHKQLTKMDTKTIFCIHFPMKKIAVVAVLFSAFMVFVLLPSPTREEAKKQHVVAEVVKEQKKEIEKLEKEVTNLSELNGEEQKKIREQLELSKKELQQISNLDEMEKAIDKIEKKMETATGSSQEKNEEGMTGASKDSIQTMRENVASAKKVLGEDASKEKKETKNGNGDGSQGESTQQPGQTGQQSSEGQSSGNTGSKNQGQNGTNKNQQGQNGNSNGSGSQSGSNGEGNEGQEGQNGTGNQASQSGNSQGNNGQGNQNGQTGTGWDYGSKNGYEADSLNKGKSVTVDKKEGNDSDLTGKAKEDGSTKTQTTKTQGGYSGKSVSYESVISSYKDKAYSSISKKEYPGTKSESIRKYFDSLNQ